MKSNRLAMVLLILLLIAIGALGGTVSMFRTRGIARESVMEVLDNESNELHRKVNTIPAMVKRIRAALPVVITPERTSVDVRWTEKERAEPTAFPVIHESDGCSYAYMRSTETARSHTHDEHDVTLICLRGRARLSLGGRDFDMPLGSPTIIARGTEHALDLAAGDSLPLVFAFVRPKPSEDFTRFVGDEESE